ncbi:MAG: hypothetical protein ABSH05_07965 [Bryobacteraceae bacterium]|jgi:hypothetical protein
MPGKKKVSRIGCGRIKLGKPSNRVEPPRVVVRTGLAELIERCLPKSNS